MTEQEDGQGPGLARSSSLEPMARRRKPDQDSTNDPSSSTDAAGRPAASAQASAQHSRKTSPSSVTAATSTSDASSLALETATEKPSTASSSSNSHVARPQAASSKPTAAANASNARPPASYTAAPASISAGNTSSVAQGGGPRGALRTNPPPSTASPLSSRNTSPTRPSQRSKSMAANNNTGSSVRDRSNVADASPIRASTTTVPSTATIPRSLSTSTTPQLQPAPNSTEASVLRRPQKQQPKPPAVADNQSAPQWPVSPRLRSPPAPNTGTRRNSSSLSQRKADSIPGTPNIVVQRATPTLTSPANSSDTGNTDPEEAVSPLTTRTPGRGQHSNAPSALETVQESGSPEAAQDSSNPSIATSDSQQKQDSSTASLPPSTQVSREASTDKVNKAGESGSDSSGNKSDTNTKSTKTSAPRGSLANSSSFTSLSKAKSSSGADNMTVETETVTSIPQAALTGGGGGERSGQGRAEQGGAVRLKPSTETIRPKKDKKRTASRKAPSINSGPASSKADVFEAKVASAVGEANSSDSDETFVYESNPPEPSTRPSRHHSRTPSTTSMKSLLEQHRSGNRAIGNAAEGGYRGVGGKRSMKFASNPYHSSGPDQDDLDRADGTIRKGASASGGASGHHSARGSRAGINNTFAENEPPTPHSKPRSILSNISRQPSRSTSPRMGEFGGGSRMPSNSNSNNRKKQGEISSWVMDGDGADDETTPLIANSTRAARSRASRRPNNRASMLQFEHYQRRRRGWVSRFAGCVVMAVLLLLLVFGVLGFIFATTKPLYSVGISAIENVLASEQELILDLVVEATNPNIIAVGIDDMDLAIFAKSSRPVPALSSPRIQQDPPFLSRRRQRWPGVSRRKEDDDADAVEQQDSHTMLLGRIFHFDSGLSFEGSPVKRLSHLSSGELKLAQPGNRTEAGGSERWERIIQHPYELIVRGVLKYQLPLTNHQLTSPVSGKILVFPEEDD